MSHAAMKIITKATSGHAYIMRDTGEFMIALDYGTGKCSSSFVPANGFHGPARPLQ